MSRQETSVVKEDELQTTTTCDTQDLEEPIPMKHKPTILEEFLTSSYHSYVEVIKPFEMNHRSDFEKLSALLARKSTASKTQHQSLVERLETLLEKVSVSSLSGVDDHKSLSTSLNHSFFEFRNIRDMFNNDIDSNMSIVSEEDVAILASHCLYMLEYYNTISSEFRDQKKLLLVLRVIVNYSENNPTTNTLRREQLKRRAKFMNHILSESERFQQLLCKFMTFSNDPNDKVQYLCAKCLSNFMKNQSKVLNQNEGVTGQQQQKKVFALNVDTLRVIGMCLETLCDKLLVKNAETFVHVHFYQLLINILYDHYIELHGVEMSIRHEEPSRQEVVDLYVHTQVKKLLNCTNQNSTFVKCLSLIQKHVEKMITSNESDSCALNSNDISKLVRSLLHEEANVIQLASELLLRFSDTLTEENKETIVTCLFSHNLVCFNRNQTQSAYKASVNALIEWSTRDTYLEEKLSSFVNDPVVAESYDRAIVSIRNDREQYKLHCDRVKRLV
ncbi:hypothetical protein C9374_013000 [Naegleria lovaniensis]|uniref:Uncharacterized protein n=1 Tax=Naegleria lovaniensis TaxID=51637 RepID=A0AA88GCF1_NAELO|nr:uncharacterized protein C9374_013000 [Naegleria lovaniensis]KAG2372970.1 hypothetical protein C9374_013000 [Naegleria lovaniensis]